MLFSEQFPKADVATADWFDVLLDTDTQLFVDPLLISKEKRGRWKDAHGRLINHFDEVFGLIARSGLDSKSPYYTQAVARLKFPEPNEFCLGYTSDGTDGAGGSVKLARQIARAMAEAIDRGIKHLDHFELLGVFNARIGPDRISDLTCTILRPYFVSYTADIAKKYGLATQEWEIAVGPTGQDSIKAELPKNPVEDRPVLLVPKRFLRRLPTLDAEDWWGWYVLKSGINIDLLEKVDKKSIVEEASRNADAVKEWAAEHNKSKGRPYDVDRDPDLLWRWDPITNEWVSANPIDLGAFKRKDRFHRVVETVVGQYKHFIEQEGGWRHLYNDDGSERDELAAQNLLRGIGKHYCHASGIEIDREVNIGRGPVDFKFSRGRNLVTLLEVKKLTSGKFWNGLERQLTTYMDADEVTDGWLLALQLRDGGVSKQRREELGERVAQVSKDLGLQIDHAVVDGREKKSASKL
ncbi:MAG TPA: hypothetical protein VH275_11270 [Solirubrobacterales bacterium]|jgi:hypothetical protein|nr:hypothetical protein [Solirubrobacterales bacterium]